MINSKNTFTEFNFEKTLSYSDSESDLNAFHIFEPISEQYNYNCFFNEKNFKFIGEKRTLQLYFDDEEVYQGVQRVFSSIIEIDENKNNIEDSVHKEKLLRRNKMEIYLISKNQKLQEGKLHVKAKMIEKNIPRTIMII